MFIFDFSLFGIIFIFNPIFLVLRLIFYFLNNIGIKQYLDLEFDNFSHHGYLKKNSKP